MLKKKKKKYVIHLKFKSVCVLYFLLLLLLGSPAPQLQHGASTPAHSHLPAVDQVALFIYLFAYLFSKRRGNREGKAVWH